MLRVFYDHQLFSLQDVGGVSRYHYELMRYMSGQPTVRVSAYLGMNHNAYPFRGLSSTTTRVIGFGSPLGPGGRRYIVNEAMGNSIAPFLGGMDVYHPTLYRLMPMIRARRIVATHHDCTHERFPEIFRYIKPVLKAKKSTYARADKIICISESSRKDLLDFHNIDPAKTHVIHHGLAELPYSAEADRAIAQIARREFLLYVGSRAHYKNFAGLLQAFHNTRLCDSFDLLVLGGGTFTAEEMALMEHLAIRELVIGVARSSDELLRSAYQAAKLFVYPSLWEGFGFSPLEAMAVGCPVVACRASSVPEVCRDAPFYFEPGDPATLERALLTGVNNEEARRHAILRGREVAAGYSWTKCGEETLALYRATL